MIIIVEYYYWVFVTTYYYVIPIENADMSNDKGLSKEKGNPRLKLTGIPYLIFGI